MGASGWHHFVPWERDVAAAFARLQAEVFERGEYHLRPKSPKPASIAALRKKAREDGTHSILDLDRVVLEPLPVSMLDWQLGYQSEHGQPPPPEMLRDRIQREVRRFGAVFAFPEDEVEETFLVEKPDHDAVQAGLFDLFSRIPRGCGVWLVVYEHGRPSELLFAGVTGD